MKTALLTLLGGGVLGTLAIGGLHSWSEGVSFGLGALIMLANLWVMRVTWPRILAKKQIAPSVAIIVFKFAILGWIIFEVVNSGRVQIGWFAAGLAMIVPATLVTTFWSDEAAESATSMDMTNSTTTAPDIKPET